MTPRQQQMARMRDPSEEKRGMPAEADIPRAVASLVENRPY
jgi:hypothetical protein